MTLQTEEPHRELCPKPSKARYMEVGDVVVTSVVQHSSKIPFLDIRQINDFRRGNLMYIRGRQKASNLL